MLAIEKSQNNRKNFECKTCHYITCNKFDYEKHINTTKHKNNDSAIQSIELSINNSQKSQEKNFSCSNCGKTYKDNSGLWRHKKKCIITTDTDSNAETIDKDQLILMLIKQNADLIKESTEFKNIIIAQNTSTQNMMMEVIKTGTHNTNITHTNSHNKAFNLNFFLNETCKDAMNIMDFVDSIKLQLNDLEKVGELGYVEGISNIIVKNLKELDVNKRPVHCTDKKRETMYIKDENKWEKDEEKKKLHKVVRKVACKNQNLIPKFKEFHPDCGKYNSKFSDQYNKIIVESMGGTGDDDYEKEEKIIKNISKQVFIDKEPN
jgi:hypothetical protein